MQLPGKPAFTFRLVASKRGDGKVRQQIHTVLAYQAVQVLRRKLNLQGINDSWLSLRQIFSGQQRVTATFTQKDGRTLHVRKTTVAEQTLQGLYKALGLSASPVGTKKLAH